MYTGRNNDKLKGFYRTKKVEANGTEVYSLATQLCATDARRVFPCWDEPDRKATFGLSLTVPTGRTALSNMPVKSHEKGSIVDTFTFEKTLKMSTYLLAFCVGRYDFLETFSKSGVKIRVYTDIGESEQGRFALDVAAKALDFYEDYFKIKYPMSKCDMIAIPDFKFGAMENWGLITYRSVAVLFDQEKSSIKRKQYVAYVVCHELAHQWFGNLVTMGWWTHLWLNEGFATFMGYLCTDFIYPEWQIWDQFMASGILNALNLDALDSSHPIEVEVGHPSETDEIFDAISYNKGCAIIRMLHNWISDECFRVGMENYLNKFKYSNAQTEDLWEELGKAAGKPVAKVMAGWTSQIGYPVIMVDTLERTSEKVVIEIKQKKFTTGGKQLSSLWSVPISILTSTGSVVSSMLEEASMKMSVDLPADGWLKLNDNFTNWHLVKYESTLLDAITSNMSKLNSLNRLNIAFETVSLVKAGDYPITSYLELIQKSYGSEKNYSLWSDASANIGLVGRLCSEIDCMESFEFFLKPIISAAMSSTNDKSSDINTKLLRALLFRLLAGVNDDQTIEQCVAEIKQFLLNDNHQIDADLKTTMLSVYAEKTNDLTGLVSLHSRVSMTELKNQVEVALGAVTEPKLQSDVIDFIMSDAVRNQDKASALIAMAKAGKTQRGLVLDYTLNNMKHIQQIFDGVDIGRYLKGLLGIFVTRADHDRISKFFEQNPISNAERSIRQGLDDIKVHANMLEQNGEQMKLFFAGQN